MLPAATSLKARRAGHNLPYYPIINELRLTVGWAFGDKLRIRIDAEKNREVALRSKFTIEAEHERARHCVRMAHETVEPSTKALLLEMARLWMSSPDALRADSMVPMQVS